MNMHRATRSGVPVTAARAAVKPGNGRFRLYKANPVKPHQEHATYDHAEAEACRLLESRPGDTFVIVQEVARVGGSHE